MSGGGRIDREHLMLDMHDMLQPVEEPTRRLQLAV
jgi:hypothetical protein